MKSRSITLYQCDFCGFESTKSSEVRECEAKHETPVKVALSSAYGKFGTAVMKCDRCEFNAVVFDTRYEKTYCPGHALVFLKEAIDACKEDKFDFVTIEDAVWKGLIK